MSALYLLVLNGRHYAIRKEEVAKVREIETAHRLPFSPEYIVGLATIDKGRTALADLAALIGLPPFAGKYPARVLLPAGQGTEPGFIFAGDLCEIDIAEESIHRMPPYLASPEFPACIAYRGRPAVLLDLQALYRLIKAKKPNPAQPGLRLSGPAGPVAVPNSIKLFNAGGEVFALPGEMVGRIIDRLPAIAPLPATPAFIKGVAFIEGAPCPVVDPAEKLNFPPGRDRERKLLEISLEGNLFGFLADNYLGELPENRFTFHDLPPLAQAPLIKAVAVTDGEIIPLLDPATLLDPTDPERRDEPSPARPSRRCDSEFARQFTRRDVEVVEFILLDGRHALPREEIEDILPIRPFRKLPANQSLVIGITLHRERIVPILDPALVFGRLSPITSDWQMILVKSGDFQAFIVSESTFQERTLPLHIHKKVPLSQTDSLVYGCYPDDNRVRLIINAAALATRFDRKGVRSFLSSHTSARSETAAAADPVPAWPEKTLRLDPPREPSEEIRPEPDGTGIRPQTAAEPDRGTDRPPAPGQGKAPIPEKPPGPDQAELSSLPAHTKLMGREANALPKGGLNRTLGVPGGYHNQSAESVIPAFLPPRREINLLSRTAASVRPAKPEIPGWSDGMSRPTGSPELQTDPDPTPPVKPEAPDEPFWTGAGTATAGEGPAATNPITRSEPVEKEAAHPKSAPEAEKDEPKTAAELLAGMREIIARQKPKEIPAGLVERRAAQKPDEAAARNLAAEPQEEPDAIPDPEADAWREFEKNFPLEDPGTPAEHERASGTPSGNARDDRQRPGPPAPLPPLAKPPNRRNPNRAIILLVLLILVVINFFIFSAARFTQDKKPPANREILAGPADLPASPAKSIQPAAPAADRDKTSIPLHSAAASRKPAAETTEEEEPSPLTIIVPDDISLPARVYTVTPGDTLWDISMRFTGTPYNYPAVARRNDIADPDLIYPGQSIYLKRENDPGRVLR